MSNDTTREGLLIPREEIERIVQVLRYTAHPERSPHADRLAQYLATPSPAQAEEVRCDGMRWETRTVRKDAPDYSEYLRARFDRHKTTGSTFEFAGHRWRYCYSSFDDAGEFDVIERPVAPAQAEGEAVGDAVTRMCEAYYGVQHVYSPGARAKMKRLLDAARAKEGRHG